MDLDLVQLQQSAKRIRNPFGFDFTVKYAKKPILFRGDGEWITVIAPLADHLANRLYMKIYYQYHDEQVAALKAKGDDKAARAFRVPADVENKIWMLITGQPKYRDLPTADDVADNADLTELRNEIKKVEKSNLQNSGPVNITKILEKANIEALPTADAVDGTGQGAHVEGAARLSDEPAPPPADTTPVDAADMAPQSPVVDQTPAPAAAPEGEAAPVEPAEVAGKQEGEFGELDQLDNGEQQSIQQP